MASFLPTLPDLFLQETSSFCEEVSIIVAIKHVHWNSTYFEGICGRFYLHRILRWKGTCNDELSPWAKPSASLRQHREHRWGIDLLAAFLEKQMTGNFSDLPTSNSTVKTCTGFTSKYLRPQGMSILADMYWESFYDGAGSQSLIICQVKESDDDEYLRG